MSIMFKMLADFLKVTPDDINKMIDEGRESIRQGLEYMASTDARMARIEAHLGITDTAIIDIEALQLDREISDEAQET